MKTLKSKITVLIILSLFTMNGYSQQDVVKNKVEISEAFNGAEQGNLDIVKSFLDQGNYIDTIYNNFTLLMTANSNNKFIVSKYLIKKGANLHKMTNNGTPLLGLDIGNYLYKDNPEVIKMTDFLISKMLSNLANKTVPIPSSKTIKNKILIIASKKTLAKDNGYNVVVQLVDVFVDSLNRNQFIVKADVAALNLSNDNTQSRMYDLCCWSGSFMPAPDKNMTHLSMKGQLGGFAMVSMGICPTKWLFVFYLNKQNIWSVKLVE